MEAGNRRIYIELNSNCNFKCNFCPYSLIKCENEIIPLEKVKEVLMDIKVNIPHRIIYFHNLNEPLLYPYIDDVIRFCSNENIEFGITTNGIFLNEHIGVIKSSKARELNISYQIVDEKMNTLRGNKLSVKQYRELLLDSIKLISKEFMGEIKIKLLSTNNSYFNGIKIVGIESINSLIEEINNIYRFYKGVELSLNQIKKISELDIKEFCKIKLFDNIYVEIFPFLTWGNYFDKVHKSFFGQCDGLSGQLQIKSNGDVTTCCYDFNSELKFGNIYDIKLSELLKSKEYGNILRKIASKCIYYERCRICLGNKKLSKNLKQQCDTIFHSKLESRFVYSENNISLCEGENV